MAVICGKVGAVILHNNQRSLREMRQNNHSLNVIRDCILHLTQFGEESLKVV